MQGNETIIAAAHEAEIAQLNHSAARVLFKTPDLFVASVGRGVFEGKTLDILRRSMVEYYADASDDEPSCREADSIERHFEDREEELTAAEVDRFNTELAEDFAAEVQAQRDEDAHIREISCPRATGRI